MKRVGYFIFILCLFEAARCASDHAEWGYREDNGPATWPSNFKGCAGDRQSPVNIRDARSYYNERLSPLVYKGYWEQRKSYELMNNGHSVEIQFPGKAPSLQGGPLEGSYVLAQIHFHWGGEGGSEHALYGHLYSMEAHLVHYKQDYGSMENATTMSDGLAVIGLLMATTLDDNPELKGLVSGLQNIQESGSKTSVPDDAMWWLRKYLDTEHYFTYQGSLTVPPCIEVVSWIVLKKHMTIGLQQIAQFQQVRGADGAAILENARPLQPLNERKIYYYSREDYEDYK